MRHNLAVAVLFLCVSSALGQTSSEFEKSFGKPVISYMVSERILMTPEYTPDGQVCMMRLHPRHFAPNASYISPRLPFEELQQVLNQLIPLHIRGAKKEPFNTGATGGGAGLRLAVDVPAAALPGRPVGRRRTQALGAGLPQRHRPAGDAGVPGRADQPCPAGGRGRELPVVLPAAARQDGVHP